MTYKILKELNNLSESQMGIDTSNWEWNHDNLISGSATVYISQSIKITFTASQEIRNAINEPETRTDPGHFEITEVGEFNDIMIDVLEIDGESYDINLPFSNSANIVKAIASELDGNVNPELLSKIFEKFENMLGQAENIKY